MGTGTPVNDGDIITAAKINKKLETVNASDIVSTDAFNFANTSSTFGNLKGTTKIQTGLATNVAAGSTDVTFPENFSNTPVIILTPVTTSTAAWQYSYDNASTAGFTIYSDTAGTIAWIAISLEG